MTDLTPTLDWLSEQRTAFRNNPDVAFTDHEKIQLKDYTYEQLEQLLMDGFGVKKFRAQQIYQWLYGKDKFAANVDDMTNLSKNFRKELGALTRASSLEHTGTFQAKDGTTKLTFKCYDNAVIETVYIPANGRNTLCISSQVGCAMGCTFCWTAKMGLRRNLSTAEIVDQVVWARRLMSEYNGHIGNIVFMGMGEPLHNYDYVVRALNVLMDGRGLDFSKRKITVSTSGLVPQLKRLGEDTNVNIAISLNGTTNEQRASIMPVNERWDIEELLECLRQYPLENRQMITFEYVLIRDLNDTIEDAYRLIKLLKGMRAKVNLIPFNPHPHTPFETPDESTIDAFQQVLVDHNVSCFRRATRGQDEMAACGQLGKPGDRKAPLHVRKRVAFFQEQKELENQQESQQ